MRTWITILVCLIGIVAQAERRHTIKLSGALADSKTKTVTVESLAKDFHTLSVLDTEWRDEGKHQFKGVTFQDFVKKYASPGVTQAKVTATNDYSQVLTVKDWAEWGAFLAFQEDGQIISTKNKGTFRIIYPYQKFDKDLSVKSMLEGNSVWQVIKVEFIKQ
jgi:hypothetical protein